MKKECDEGKVRNEATGRCIKIKKVPECKAGKIRSQITKRCKKTSLDLFVFGSNPFGALGLGEDVTEKLRPAIVNEKLNFVQIACGGMHTVALSTKNQIWTWGVNDEGALGRMTTGTVWQNALKKKKQDSTIPGKVRLPKDVVPIKIVAGDGITFALTKNGEVYGCGTFKDDGGGEDHFIDKYFKKIHLDSHVKDIACGTKHVVVLTFDDEVLSWGINNVGQLGRTPKKNQFIPSKVPNVKQMLKDKIAKICCGNYNTFVISEKGDVLAWGLNNSGQLGKETKNNIEKKPCLIQSLKNIIDIAGGEQHTLALDKHGQLLSFGTGTYGMLGRSNVKVDSNNNIYPIPSVVEFPKEQIIKILAGSNVSGCITLNGNLYLWGSNVNNQLGKGNDNSDSIVPTKLQRTKVFGYRKIYEAAFGGQHIAILTGDPGSDKI